MGKQSACPRLNLLKVNQILADTQAVVKTLPKHLTFDHIFLDLRADERNWFLKAKPIRYEIETPLEEYVSFAKTLQVSISARVCFHILLAGQRPELADSVRKGKLKPKDYSILADAVANSLPIPEDIVTRNVGFVAFMR